MANARTGAPRRPQRTCRHPEEPGQLPVPVPRQLQHGGGDDAQPVPGARGDERRLQGDELAAVHGVHILRRRHQQQAAGGAPPQPVHDPGPLRQEQVGLRQESPHQGDLEEDLPLAQRRRVGAAHPRAARRSNGQDRCRQDPVPAP
ncbi:hypothetical protein VPH35_018429 [Triticum aestivum]